MYVARLAKGGDPNEHQEDGEAGPSGPVVHQGLVTGGPRPGARAPGRRSLDREETLLRPRLKRTVDAVESAAGDIYILRPGADSDLVIEQPDRIARGLLAALDGTRSAAELEREFGGERVRSALEDLAGAALLEDAADDELVSARERERYDRQLRYFPTSPRPARRPRITTGASARRASPCLASAGSAAGRPTRSPAVAWASWSWSTAIASRRATSTARSSTANAT